MFVRNAWYVAAWGPEIVAKPFARRLLDEPVVLFRRADGAVAALEDKCCHRGLPLAMGEVIGQNIRCGYHGLLYDGDGRCVKIPGQEKIPASMRVRSYPVCEQDELLWIWMGEPERADTVLIPRFPYHNEWPHKPYTQRIRCNYQLVIDNLLDQTHLPYIHKSTIGGSAESQAHADFDVQQTRRGVKFSRWLRNTPPPPIYVKADIGFKPDDVIDRWQDFEYFAPGSVEQFTGGLPAEARAYETGRRDGGWALRIFHNITPETEGSCFYFWAGCHGFRKDDPKVTEWLFQGIASTFKEDEVVLEAQQARLTELPGGLHGTKHDEGRVGADRALKAMLAEDGRIQAAAGEALREMSGNLRGKYAA
jgi:vanillate O-demethylase monooxygenase subunit